MMKTSCFSFVCVLFVWMGLPLSGNADQRIALLGAADSWFEPERGFHAAFMAAYDVDGIGDGMHFGARFNTDTLRLSLERIPIYGTWLHTGVRAAYEHRFAGLLTDHYIRGKNEPSRGFEASYLLTQAYLKADLPSDHYLELDFGVRKWLFSTSGETASGLVLPQEAWVFEPQIVYTYWRLADDASLKERHRLFPRVRGLAFGISFGVDVRNHATRWGYIEGTIEDPEYDRNNPDRSIAKIRQWLRAGIQLQDWMRLQVYQTAAFGEGEDDLTRVRLGGLNPYVVPLAGAPWAAFLSEKFLAFESSLHINVGGGVEAGMLAHAVVLEDAGRNGRKDVYDLQNGVGLFIDARLGNLQLDIRSGWSPSIDWKNTQNHLGLFGSLGWQWD